MNDPMEELQNSLSNIYTKNLNFLQSNHYDIFEKIEDLSEKINNKTYIEELSLEYKDEGYFDIYNSNNKEYIYGFNSYLEADKRRDLTDLTEKQSINLLRVDDRTNKLGLMATLGEINPLVNFLNETIDNKNLSFSQIYKFIFIGVGAGIHIHEINKKINPMNTLIIEPNIELFRLSLFLIDYSIFDEGNRQLFLSIGNNKIERNTILHNFTTNHSYMNYNIKHHLFHPDQSYILDELISFYSDNNPMSFPYHALLQVFERTVGFMKAEHKFLKKDLFFEKSMFKDEKVLIICAGPSLDQSIDWIYENQDKFVIVCVDVILRKLEKNNIVPDIVVSIDPSHLCANYLTTEDKDYLKNSAIIFLSQQHEETIDAVKDLNFYFSQVMSISKEIGYVLTAPNVGAFSFVISATLGAKELYLIGNDAAFNQDTGSRYSTDSSHSQMENLNIYQDSNLIKREDIQEVKGNFRDTIKSTRDLLTFRNIFQECIPLLGDNYTAYNLSDGAYMEGFTPLKHEDINLAECKIKEFNSIEELNKCSDIVNDLNFEGDIKIINNIILRVKKFKNLKIKSKNQFMQEKLDLMIWILEKKKELKANIFADIFLKFLDIIDIYINYMLNLDQKDIYTKENINKLKRFWCDTLVSLLKDMNKSIS